MSAENTLPDMQSIHQPAQWQSLRFGETEAIDKKRYTLAAKDTGVRWLMEGLATDSDDLILLLKGRVRSKDLAHTQAQIEVSVRCNASAPEIRLAVLVDSPYGAFSQDGHPVQAGVAWMRDKGRNHVDLNQDYMHFKIPAQAINPDGTCLINVISKDNFANLSFERDKSCLVAMSGGSFFINMQKGSCIVLAQVGYLSAIALLVACFSNIGVTLLAGLTAFFGALLLSYIHDMAPAGKIPNFVVRFLDLLQVIIPDFNYFGVEGTLAGGRAISWQLVSDAWLYYGMYSSGFLIVAWLLMSRREL